MEMLRKEKKRKRERKFRNPIKNLFTNLKKGFFCSFFTDPSNEKQNIHMEKNEHKHTNTDIQIRKYIK